MRNLNGLLKGLEEKYGAVTIDVQDHYGCTACFYDDDCRSCKGNATGN